MFSHALVCSPHESGREAGLVQVGAAVAEAEPEPAAVVDLQVDRERDSLSRIVGSLDGVVGLLGHIAGGRMLLKGVATDTCSTRQEAGE